MLGTAEIDVRLRLLDRDVLEANQSRLRSTALRRAGRDAGQRARGPPPRLASADGCRRQGSRACDAAPAAQLPSNSGTPRGSAHVAAVRDDCRGSETGGTRRDDIATAVTTFRARHCRVSSSCSRRFRSWSLGREWSSGRRTWTTAARAHPVAAGAARDRALPGRSCCVPCPGPVPR